MITCIACKGKGKFKPIDINKTFNIFGIDQVELTNLRIYKCDRCGKEIMPERTIERIKKFQSEFYNQPTNQETGSI
ncbi:MAG: YgiT-type zinc finger protein, partial [Desulfobacteraceae bacterium]|nr:YgiT-type zinc finger protein [Desulfobacteraceae bacterium]